jgi:hypothetical protein
MAVASNPMNEANAKAMAIPAAPVIPPARIAVGSNDAARLTPPSGPPLTRIATATVRSASTSRTRKTPSTFAPMSTDRRESAVTIAHASPDQTSHGRSMP